MRNTNKHISKEVKHALVYLILSTFWSIVDCWVFLTLTKLWLRIIPSNIISNLCWMITSFSLNVKKNFKQNDYIKLRFFSYFCISIIWMIISTGLVYLFIQIIWLNPTISKIYQILIIAIPLYIANRYFTFRKSPKSLSFNWKKHESQ